MHQLGLHYMDVSRCTGNKPYNLKLTSEVVKKWHEFPNHMDGRILIFFNKPRTDMKYAIQPQSVIILLTAQHERHLCHLYSCLGTVLNDTQVNEAETMQH